MIRPKIIQQRLTMGKGLIPSEVSGFYKLQQAPWSLVMIAPGSEILAHQRCESYLI